MRESIPVDTTISQRERMPIDVTENRAQNRMYLSGKYGPYTIDYDKYTSLKLLKTLRNTKDSYTAVWVNSYSGFTMQ